MAEAVIERTSKKKQKSFARSRNIQDRAKGWDDINKEAAEEEAQADKAAASRNRFEGVDGDGTGAEGGEWETDEEVTMVAGETTVPDAAVPQTTGLRDADDDLIL